MGRDSSTGQHILAYGVPIKVPHHPDWVTMRSRLTNFPPNNTLFAAAARVVGKDRLDEDDISAGLPEQIIKSAKLATPSILISTSSWDLLSEEEKKLDRDDFSRVWQESFDRIASLADGAIDKILGKDHGFVLMPYRAETGYEEDDFNAVDPVVFLFTKVCTSNRQSEPEVQWHDVVIPPMSKEEKSDIDGKIDQILRAFSSEAETSPGWKLVVSNSCYPR